MICTPGRPNTVFTPERTSWRTTACAPVIIGIVVAPSGMRSPRRRRQQLDLMGDEQWAEFRGETLDEILVGEHRGPVRATVGIIIELPEMDQLIDRARVGLEVTDQLLVLAAFLEG